MSKAAQLSGELIQKEGFYGRPTQTWMCLSYYCQATWAGPDHDNNNPLIYDNMLITTAEKKTWKQKGALLGVMTEISQAVPSASYLVQQIQSSDCRALQFIHYLIKDQESSIKGQGWHWCITHLSRSGGTISSGRRVARYFNASPASWDPNFPNMAMRATGLMHSTKRVISSSVSLWESGIACSQVGFRYRSLSQT